MRDHRSLPILAALVTVTLWASAFVGIRAAGADFSPGALTLGRLLVGAIALGLLVVVRRAAWPPRRDVPRLLICGLLWFGAYNVLLNAAEQQVDAGTAAMLVGLGPLFIAVLAGTLLGEGFPRALVIGGSIAFVGALLTGYAVAEGGFDAGLGAVLCVAAAASYAGGVVAQKPLLARTSALQVTFLACAIGAVACLPFLPDLLAEVSIAEPAALAWLVYLGVVPTAIGFTTWAYALARTTAGRMGATTYLVSPIAVLLGWLVLAEVPPTLALLGGALCVVGVAVSRGARLPRLQRAQPSVSLPGGAPRP